MPRPADARVAALACKPHAPDVPRPESLLPPPRNSSPPSPQHPAPLYQQQEQLACPRAPVTAPQPCKPAFLPASVWLQPFRADDPPPIVPHSPTPPLCSPASLLLLATSLRTALSASGPSRHAASGICLVTLRLPFCSMPAPAMNGLTTRCLAVPKFQPLLSLRCRGWQGSHPASSAPCFVASAGQPAWRASSPLFSRPTAIAHLPPKTLLSAPTIRHGSHMHALKPRHDIHHPMACHSTPIPPTCSCFHCPVQCFSPPPARPLSIPSHTAADRARRICGHCATLPNGACTKLRPL